METPNVNNPQMLSGVSGKPIVKGAFIAPNAGMVVKMRPFLAYTPNEVLVRSNKSRNIDCSSTYPDGDSPVVTTPGMFRWITLVMDVTSDLTNAVVKVYAGESNTDADVKKPDRGSFVYFNDTDIILADIRLYYGMTTVVVEDIDMSRAETANHIDATLIPLEVYGPPLNAYFNVEDAIAAINNGAMDYRYVQKNGADFIKFLPIDIGSCTSSEIPAGAKSEGAMYFIVDGADRYLAINLGCVSCEAACQGVCESYDVANEGVKKFVMTDPPAGFCGASCDVSCDGSNDVIPCVSCDTTSETFCGLNCQVACEIACDAGAGTDTATACGASCQVACESAYQTFCQVSCQLQCEADLQTQACTAVCEASCQSGYQTS